MRTTLVIDEQLMHEAMQLSGLSSKREAIEEGLRLLVQSRRQQQIRTLRGKLRWEGDLDALRGETHDPC